jgi:hypothetical protein
MLGMIKPPSVKDAESANLTTCGTVAHHKKITVVCKFLVSFMTTSPFKGRFYAFSLPLTISGASDTEYFNHITYCSALWSLFNRCCTSKLQM